MQCAGCAIARDGTPNFQHMQQNLFTGTAYLKWFCEKFQTEKTVKKIFICLQNVWMIEKLTQLLAVKGLLCLERYHTKYVGRAMLQRGKWLMLFTFAPDSNQSGTPCSAFELERVWENKKAKEECWPAWHRGVADILENCGAMSSWGQMPRYQV